MKKYKIVLFDLDGTLTDPKEGITKSIQYALEKMGIEELDLEKLTRYIGPPLQETFSRGYKMDDDEVKKAIDFYRERFKEIGMFENKLYHNIPQLLNSLAKDYTLVVATSKPTVFSETILNHFNLDHYFDLIVGSNLDGTRSSKTEIIQYILDKYDKHPLGDFIMIGDRKHDLIGAKNTGIDSIGVTYGYGSVEELKSSNPNYLVNEVIDIETVIRTHSRV
ncbi:HAD family hydrolase [Litchfieldia salsa]|uniref:Phosphoglycolate phosphatase n=1 Tax=Litchfieldia salsa TaxID=930152 RepID=A0A1H0TA33_9BACI|nr:HAD family hydrolase [Litchfieldia salsa]SDP50560.1 phosphoglycolate phosphatase [Litchfieldia salsa]